MVKSQILQAGDLKGWVLEPEEWRWIFVFYIVTTLTHYATDLPYAGFTGWSGKYDFLIIWIICFWCSLSARVFTSLMLLISLDQFPSKKQNFIKVDSYLWYLMHLSSLKQFRFRSNLDSKQSFANVCRPDRFLIINSAESHIDVISLRKFDHRKFDFMSPLS